jgi:hypothetical protein
LEPGEGVFAGLEDAFELQGLGGVEDVFEFRAGFVAEVDEVFAGEEAVFSVMVALIRRSPFVLSNAASNATALLEKSRRRTNAAALVAP